MSDLFNTPFESGLRTMLVLYLSDYSGMTIDRITAYDFITIYGKDFGISHRNLHGSNHFSFSEFSSMRALCLTGIKELIVYGLVDITYGINGILYTPTSKGIHHVETLHSDYKVQYLETLENVMNKYSSSNDAELIAFIGRSALAKLRRL